MTRVNQNGGDDVQARSQGAFPAKSLPPAIAWGNGRWLGWLRRLRLLRWRELRISLLPVWLLPLSPLLPSLFLRIPLYALVPRLPSALLEISVDTPSLPLEISVGTPSLLPWSSLPSSLTGPNLAFLSTATDTTKPLAFTVTYNLSEVTHNHGILKRR
jgi:hypothetical protein